MVYSLKPRKQVHCSDNFDLIQFKKDGSHRSKNEQICHEYLCDTFVFTKKTFKNFKGLIQSNDFMLKKQGVTHLHIMKMIFVLTNTKNVAVTQ